MAKVAMVGCGYWGKNLVRNFSELGVLAAVVDHFPETAQKMGEQYNVPAKTFEEVVSDPSIDAIALATPASAHAEQAVAAMEGGKHVYIEKPIALDIEDAEKILETGKRLGKTVMVGHLMQYHPIFRKAVETANSGLLGKVYYVYSNRMSLGKFRNEENVMWSFAPHDFSMILSIIDEMPTTVTAQGNVFYTEGVADMATVQMKFPSGTGAHIQTSWMNPFKEQKLTIIGDKGSLVFEDTQPIWEDKLTFYPHSVDVSGQVPVPTKLEARRIVVDKSEPLKNECQHFVECVDKGLHPRTDGDEGIRVLKVLQQAGDQLADYIQR